MEQFKFMQSRKRINYHDDIILRTPTVSIGERMLDVYFKNQSFNGSSILEVKYPICEKDIHGILKDLCLNADKQILAIQTERRLNDLISVQCYPSNTDSSQEDIMQSWHTRTVSNCNLVEMPHSVSNLCLQVITEFSISWKH